MKRGALCAVGILSIGLFSLGCFAAIPVTDFTVKKLTPVDVFFVGKTKPLDKVTLGFDIQGKIERTKQVGDIVHSPIFDGSGKELRKGTVVAALYKQRQKFELNAAEMNVKIAKYDLKQSLDDYKRNQLMIKKNAISRKAHDESKIEVMKAKMTLDNAENSLSQAKYNLAATDIITPFTGIVSQVLRGKNLGTGDDGEVIEVVRMNPMLVEIPFAPELIDRLGKQDVVKVYPPGMSKPVPTWVEFESFGIQNLEVYVPNKLISETYLTPEQRKLPKVYEVFPVMPIVNSNTADIHDVDFKDSNGKSPLAIPVEALHRDKNGSYVFIAQNQRCFSLKEGIDKEFTVKKVYVELGNIRRYFNIGNKSGVQVTSIKNGSVKEGDIVVLHGDKSIKNGSKVVREEQRWMFYPDQKVKIEIPAISGPGFYVPKDAIIHQAAGSNFVYAVEGNKAKLIKVGITGLSPDNYSILGNGIKEGTKIIVVKDKSKIDQLYDGAEIKVTNTLPPLTRIEHKRAYNAVIPLDSIKFFNN
ncbi:MAG TPA: hypothetical protein QF753_02565 [Victivallales bacterium]|nr:hypothetical protein [Victivallales bacterium]